MKTIAGYFLMGLAVLIAATGQANAQVTINFDNLACNTYVTNQYSQVTFSSAGGYTPITYCYYNYGTTLPSLSRANFYGLSHYAELTLDFTRPVGALTYYTLGSDNLGVVAKIDVYRSGSFSQTLNFYGSGNQYIPIFTDLRPFGNDITRIRIYNITDIYGLAFDNFNFTPLYVDITNSRVGNISNGSTQNALLGADISLQANGSQSVGTYSWTFTGPYSISGGSQSSSAVTIRSTNTGTITAKVTYTTNGLPASSTVTINAVLPTLTSFTAQQNGDRIAAPYACSSTDFFWEYILGCKPPNVGMSFSASVQAPATFISNPAQSGIKYVQAISVFRKRVRAGDLECLTRRVNETTADNNSWMLDTVDPYGKFFPEYPAHYFSEGNLLVMPTVDYPREALTFIQDKEFEDAVSVDDRFNMYVFYFNGTDPSSPIIQRPLGVLSWNWGGLVVFDPPGSHVIRSSNSAPGPRQGGATTSAVTFNGNVKDLPFVLCPGAPPASTSVIDGSRRFVRQHYLDFLGRDPAGDQGHSPDPDGWNYWTAQITECAFNFDCIRARRLSVSLSFFYSGEFIVTDPIMAHPPGSPGFDPATYNPRFVYYCYRKYLNRDPDPGGWTFYTDGLNRTGDYRGVVNDFITSYEYRNIRFPIN